jgi:hypothetical protein
MKGMFARFSGAARRANPAVALGLLLALCATGAEKSLYARRLSSVRRRNSKRPGDFWRMSSIPDFSVPKLRKAPYPCASPVRRWTFCFRGCFQKSRVVEATWNELSRGE